MLASIFSLTAAVLLTARAPGPTSCPGRAPDDAQIAHIAVTANEIDVTAARQALDKSSNDQVRAFAETMIRDHAGIIEKAGALTKKLGVTPEDNDTSRSLASSAKSERDRLAGLSGAEFDRAYVENEVDYHRKVIDAVEETLIPNTSNAELKQLLQSVLPALKAHLEQAERVAAALKR